MTRLGISLISTLICTTAFAGDTILLVQDNAYPPFMLEQDGKSVGIIADIVAEAASRIDGDYDVKVESVPWQRALAMVESGDAQGILGTYYRPEARPWIGVYSEPVTLERVVVLCRDGLDVSGFAYPADFAGLTFGNNAGFKTPGDAFFAMVDSGDIKLDETKTTEQNLQKLAAGRIDCYVQEELSAQMAANAEGVTGFSVGGEVSVEKSMIGYNHEWATGDNMAFIEAMNAAIKDVKADGTADKITATNVGG